MDHFEQKKSLMGVDVKRTVDIDKRQVYFVGTVPSEGGVVVFFSLIESKLRPPSE